MAIDDLTLEYMLDLANFVSDTSLVSLTDENAFEPLLALLFSDQLAINEQIDEQYRIAIANCLIKLNEPIAKPLFDYLKHKPQIHYKKEGAKNAIHREHDHNRSRNALVEILGALDEEIVLPSLLNILQETDNFKILRSTLSALVTVESGEGIRLLTEMLLSPAESTNLRKMIARTFGDFPHHPIEMPLVLALKDESKDIVMIAMESLGKIKSKVTLPFLLESLADIPQPRFIFGSSSQIKHLLDTIQAFHSEETDRIIFDWCITALKSKNVSLKHEAVKRVATLHDKRAIPVLVDILNSKPKLLPSLSDTIQEALQRINTPRAITALTDWQRNNP